MGEYETYRGGAGYGKGDEKIDDCGMERLGTLDSSEKTITILGDRWWPPTAKQNSKGQDKQKLLCNIWNKRNKRPIVGAVSIRSKNGAPSRKGCVVKGQMTKDAWSND